VDADPDRVRAGTAAIEREGALVETAHAPWRALPFETASFDVAVARDVLMALPPGERSGCLAEILRLLRPGGRIIVIEPLPRRGLAALVGRVPVDADYESDGGAVPALIAAGFSAARVLADRKGTRFVEAAKRQSTAD
jgi:SAM-dependent methyltransferase